MPAKQPLMYPAQKKLLVDLGERLRLARLRRALTVDIACERAGISRMTLFRLESGSSAVALGTLVRVLTVLSLENDLELIARDDRLGRMLQDQKLPPRRRNTRREQKKIREVDVRHAQMQARAVRAVLEHSEWVTAEQIGELGGFSKSNLAAPANRWKQERKIFALPHQGQDRFPRYALDEAYRPLPVVETVLQALGAISPWRIAAWFESTNAWLGNRRPRECVALEPEGVLEAALRYRSSGTHG